VSIFLPVLRFPTCPPSDVASIAALMDIQRGEEKIPLFSPITIDQVKFSGTIQRTLF
jgi:hypothetical protein